MTRYSLRTLFQHRTRTFSAIWLEIFKARFALCLVVVVFSLANPRTDSSPPLFLAVFCYFAFNIALGLFDATTLQLKRWRTVPEIADVIVISFIIYYGGGPQSSWFLLYGFPIMSAARYLGLSGCVSLAVFAAIAYAFLNYYGFATNNLDSYAFSLRVLFLGGVSVVSRNLAKIKQHEEERLTKVFEEIDEAILSNVEVPTVLSFMLTKAIELTGSDTGQMKLFDSETGGSNLLTAIGASQRYERCISPLTESYSRELMDSKNQFMIATIGRSRLKRDLRTSFGSVSPSPKSALVMRLSLDQATMGVMAVYSRKRIHYTETEALALRSFGPLVAIAQKKAELYSQIASAAKENKDRLNMLHEIAALLKADQGLPDLFAKVVQLIYNRLNSEEAALFVPPFENADQIEKKAVKGPSRKITGRLESVETYYKSGESLAGRVYESKQRYWSNQISEDVAYVEEYSKILPSGTTCHYIGVPLVIGDEVLGIIRVINKKAKNYSMAERNHQLSEEGFDEDDVELMETIATQVASAIRNANLIATNRSFHYLVENSPDPIIVLDEKGKIDVFNEACEQIWGYSADEVKGKPVEECYESLEHAKEIGKELWKRKGYRIHDYEARIKACNGEIIPIGLSARLLFEKGKTDDDKGKQKDRTRNREGERLIGSIGVFKDLREIKRLQQNEKLAAVAKLMHKVVHDIKTDLATIQNFVSPVSPLVTGAAIEPEESLQAYKAIREAAGRASEKLQSMLTTASPKKVQMEAVAVKDLFQGMEEAMRQQANGKQVELLVNLPMNNYRLMADKDQMRQIVSNLFRNSLDAIAEKQKRMNANQKGRIEVSTRVHQDQLELHWTDNGCGIPKRSVPNLFAPFFTSKAKGNGLGLFIVKSLIESHGGKISVTSDEGNGTSFQITLPLLKESGSN